MTSLIMTCPYYANLLLLNFYVIDATFKLPLMYSFLFCPFFDLDKTLVGVLCGKISVLLKSVFYKEYWDRLYD